MLTHASSPSGRRALAAPADRRRATRPRVERTLRARADAAIISQWLSEQAAPVRSPKAPAAAA